MDNFVTLTLLDNKRISFPVDSIQLVKVQDTEEQGLYGTKIEYREKEYGFFFGISKETWSDVQVLSVRQSMETVFERFAAAIKSSAEPAEIENDNAEEIYQLKNALKEIWSNAVDLAQVDHEKGQEYISLENLRELIQEVEPE
ncbi:hypothetical protein [Oceanobacillus neutriphilus]|uniref:Uncharacterized protein n=1 Tax=Oceanobacillus neutriphilus TaxID=531815 RepID=A0ABQ2NPS7_9BACI|nr:hypothetical protein [Oceanobacillus neutriphilus]GGP07324.1 hypothetical protein GCM10011346_02860 [Oceanobacillus neutriphilus]